MWEQRAAVTVFTLMVCVWGGVAEDCSYVSLFKHLNLNNKTDSQAHLRPVRNWTTQTVVRVNMVVYGIIEVNEKAQTFTVQTWRSTEWKNEFLSWDPKRFCGIRVMEVPRGMMWIPDIYIQEDTSDNGATLYSRHLQLLSDGSVSSMAKGELKAICQMNLYHFPVDVQRCNISFGPFSLSGIAITQLSDGTFLTNLSETHMATNGEWEMTRIAIYPGFETYNEIKVARLNYQITLKRRPMLYIINCILPLFYFLVLDVGTFFISEARGEKLSLKVTLLLSISVLLLILQDILPSTSDQLPLIALYSIIIFSLMALSLMEAMLVSFLIDLDSCPAKPEPAPSCVVTETQMEAPQAEPSEERPEEEQGEKEAHQDLFLLKLILEEVKSVRQEVPSEVSPGDRKLGFYSRLAVKIDVTFFWVYVITNVLFLLYIYALWTLV